MQFHDLFKNVNVSRCKRRQLINKIIQQINVKTQLLKEKQQKAKNSDNKYLVIVINQEKQHGNKDYQVRPPLPLQFALPKSEDKKDDDDDVVKEDKEDVVNDIVDNVVEEDEEKKQFKEKEG